MLVDPATGVLTGVASRALRAHEEAADLDLTPAAEAPVEAELFTQQIETQTPPCASLDELERELRRGRRSSCVAATAAGAAAVAVAAPVLLDSATEISPHPRYQRIREQYGELASSSLACATHVHVELADGEDGARILDGIAPWLPVLLAISANSPYYHGRDTGYASWRAQIWTRWPSHGTGEAFGDGETYRRVARRLAEWGAGLDDAMVYFDARLSPDHPTLEVRVADVTTELEDAVLVAALARGLVTTYAAGRPPVQGWRSDLLRAASWRASRFGITGRLVHPEALELVSAREAIASLVDHVRPALEHAGDLDVVQSVVERLLARGNGAVQQRRAFERGGGLPAVVEETRWLTEASWREHATWVAG